MVIKDRAFTLALLLAAALLSSSLPSLAGSLEPYHAEGLDFELEDLGGRPRGLPDHRGKVLVVNFWASWCGPCITEIPSLRELQEQMAGKPFEILAINYMEGKFKVHKFTGMVEMPFTVLLDPDGATFKAWGAQVLPTSFLLDTDGRVRYWVQGPIEWTSPEVIKAVEGLLPEGAVAPPLRTARRTE